MKLEVFLSWLNNGLVVDSTTIVKAPGIITEKTMLEYVRTKVSTVGFENYISLSWRPVY